MCLFYPSSRDRSAHSAVPFETVCRASSPGSISQTMVWISHSPSMLLPDYVQQAVNHKSLWGIKHLNKPKNSRKEERWSWRKSCIQFLVWRIGCHLKDKKICIPCGSWSSSLSSCCVGISLRRYLRTYCERSLV